VRLRIRRGKTRHAKRRMKEGKLKTGGCKVNHALEGNHREW
jgi:hypothetical protein